MESRYASTGNGQRAVKAGVGAARYEQKKGTRIAGHDGAVAGERHGGLGNQTTVGRINTRPVVDQCAIVEVDGVRLGIQIAERRRSPGAQRSTGDVDPARKAVAGIRQRQIAARNGQAAVSAQLAAIRRVKRAVVRAADGQRQAELQRDRLTAAEAAQVRRTECAEAQSAGIVVQRAAGQGIRIPKRERPACDVRSARKGVRGGERQVAPHNRQTARTGQLPAIHGRGAVAADVQIGGIAARVGQVEIAIASEPADVEAGNRAAVGVEQKAVVGVDRHRAVAHGIRVGHLERARADGRGTRVTIRIRQGHQATPGNVEVGTPHNPARTIHHVALRRVVERDEGRADVGRGNAQGRRAGRRVVKENRIARFVGRAHAVGRADPVASGARIPRAAGVAPPYGVVAGPTQVEVAAGAAQCEGGSVVEPDQPGRTQVKRPGAAEALDRTGVLQGARWCRFQSARDR